MPVKPGTGYLVDHGTIIYLMGPKGEPIGQFGLLPKERVILCMERLMT